MIYTVTGPIDKAQMGKTLAHEHFNWINDEDFAGRMYFSKQYDEGYNQKVFDQILPILKELKALGCQTIVEASPPLGGQNLKLLHQLSSKTGVNIIPCTGMNITKYTYEIFKYEFETQLAERWIKDFEEGLDLIENGKIKPGYIKLLLDRGNISEVDQAMLKAAAIACKATGMPIHCHVLEAKQMPRVIEILEEMAVPPAKFLWAHADQEGHVDTILNIAKMGYWVGFDTIREGTYESRQKLIQHAILHDYVQQVILSQDYDLYEESEKETGIERYCAFFNTFIPHCIDNGIDKEAIENMITNNPARFYDI